MVSCFLVRCFVFEGLAKQQKSEGPQLFAGSPTLGAANMLLVVLLFALGLWFHSKTM